MSAVSGPNVLDSENGVGGRLRWCAETDAIRAPRQRAQVDGDRERRADLAEAILRVHTGGL